MKRNGRGYQCYRARRADKRIVARHGHVHCASEDVVDHDGIDRRCNKSSATAKFTKSERVDIHFHGGQEVVKLAVRLHLHRLDGEAFRVNYLQDYILLVAVQYHHAGRTAR